MDGSRQFHLSLPLPPGFFSAFRLSADIYEDTNRGSQQGSRRPCVVCLSPLSRYLYDRENVSLALTRTDRKQSVIAPWKNADETEPARARVWAATFPVSRGCGEKRRGCFHHYVYYLTSWRARVSSSRNEQQFVLRETRIKATRFRALVPTFPSPPT